MEAKPIYAETVDEVVWDDVVVIRVVEEDEVIWELEDNWVGEAVELVEDTDEELEATELLEEDTDEEVDSSELLEDDAGIFDEEVETAELLDETEDVDTDERLETELVLKELLEDVEA